MARPEVTGRAPAPDCLVYTVVEAGELLGLSRNGAYEAARRGDFPTIRIGKLILVPRGPFNKLLGIETA